MFLAVLMLFTCVGSAIPAFAEEATSSAATVDSGDPVLADSSAGGDSTSDTGADLPDDTPQQPTLPSGEDISEETPPADESDGEAVPPADSDSAEEPATPDSGDSIPDESESEPEEQPGEDDTDVPESELPDGEEPDPDEDEELPEDEPEDVPFEALVILDPENGATVRAEVGEEVTFKAPVNREDIAVAYQWQRFQKPAQGSVRTEALYNYAEGETTEYWYALEDMREAEALGMNPDMLWPGIEMYYATVAALDEIGADSSDVSIAWKTPNFALDGYTISAAETENGIEIYADKDDERHTARLNENSEWEFGEAEAKPETTGAWLNIDGTNGPEYTFAVTERDYDASFRCEITVLDEAYLEQCAAILAEQGIELTEEQRAEEQKLYSVVMSVESGEPEALPEDEAMTFSAARSMLRAAASGKPHLSADAQWVEGLNNTYEYITKDTYDRVSKWLANGEITQEQADRYWSRMLSKGFGSQTLANVLDADGKPTGATRAYNGFDLTDGMLEINSEWYGKTVYFRVHGAAGTGVAINVPAYTELETDGNGNYVEAASGTRYKRAIAFLNAFVPDAQSMYKNFLNQTTSDGWLLGQDENGNPTSNTKDMHIRTYIVNCDDFNKDPQRYMVDAEGNYRVDSVGWGVCVYEEPDLSGKAYWVLKDYLANGYGFLSGHDTMYAYAGAYYDAYGTDLDENLIDPNDGTTWYYAVNSWLPYGYTRDGRQNANRGGHFYMNQLMGSNKGNVYSETTKPSDSVSMILSTGGSHGIYGKNVMFGNNELRVRQFGYTAAQAEANAKYRTPTNYPYSYESRPVFPASYTHTNQQAAFGPIWVDYTGNNEYAAEEYGYYDHSLTWNVDGKTGTNNFYLSGTGNFLLNQIGHLPKNAASILESFLFANSVFYVSQRKQCEVCAANQAGQETVHFVRRINSANAEAVLSALQAGGSYWYPIDGCYQLVEDLTLPEDWTPIKGFRGHWNSDVYTVTLNSKGTPLLDNTSADGESGWNLGVNRANGTQTVFNSEMTRTTGVARVLGDLNDLFGTDMNYAGYTVKILGKDNPKYMGKNEEYTCTVNPDSKYVISNLPCVYNETGHFGILNARVYRPNGTEVTEYGTIRANVPISFWDNDMTTPLYLGSFNAEPISDYETYESAQAYFLATGTSSENLSVDRWEYSSDAGETWQTVPESWDKTVTGFVQEPGTNVGEGDSYVAVSRLVLNKVDPAWDGYMFRAVFKNEHGEWNTFRYFWQGDTASNDEFEGSNEAIIATNYKFGILNVRLWPAYAEQSPDQIINESDSATFRAYGAALDDGTKISVKWQYSTPKYVDSNGKEVFDWHYISDDNEFGGLQNEEVDAPVVVTPSEVDYALHGVAPDNNLDLFHEKAVFHGVETRLTVRKVDITQNGTHFRAEFKAVTAYGTEYVWYSDIADNFSGSWNTDNGSFGNYGRVAVEDNSNKMTILPPDLNLVTKESASFAEGAVNQDLMTPDEYGQTLLLKTLTSSVASGTAVYRAEIYYRPTEMQPDAIWQYITYQDRIAKPWSTEVAHSLGYGGVTVGVENSDPMPASRNGDDNWMVYTSTMTINNVPSSMYNPESLLKYYFRCVAATNYSTVKSEKSLASTDKWGGLTLDYAIAVWHNGVIEYDNENVINGSTVTDAKGVQDATANRTYSDWYFPKLAIRVPVAHHVNTAIVYFDETAGFDSRDSLIVDVAAIRALGITVQENTGKKLTLVSNTMNTVELATWQKALREYVGFRSYDANADYAYDKIVSGTTGGGGIKWIVDEARLAGLVTDPASGHAYKLVTWSSPVDWQVAKQRALQYDSELQMAGRLVEISDATENEIVRSLAGGRNVWLGGYRSGNSFRWDTNGAVVSYLPWMSGAATTNSYLYMTSNGRWNSGPVITTEHKDYTKTYGGTNWASASGNGPIYTNTSAIYISPAAYRVDVSISATSNDRTGDCLWYVDCVKNGVWEDGSYVYSGWHAINSYPNYTYSTTGNITAVRATALQNARAHNYSCSVKINSVTAYIKEDVTVTKNPVYAAVIEYVPQSLNMAITDHSATDDAVIGTNAILPEEKPGQIVVDIDGDAKVYDGTPIYPSKFEVSGPSGANRSLFDITYTAVEPGNYADYTDTTVRGGNYQESGAVNATRYHAKLTLTQESIDAGWVIDELNSQTECDLIIYQRPINVYSYHNNRVYDQTSAGIINNIQPEARVGDSGIIPGDTVRFNTTTVYGSYVDKNGKSAVHNSDTNNGGNEYTMYRNAKLSDLFIVHSEDSDPHHNYRLGTETYTGAINRRPVVVHSLYLEDPDHPRNVKTYDSTNRATITDILIDNVLPGDEIGLKQQTMTGTYATEQAGEPLTADGKVQKDRFKKLQENVITASTNAELTGNDYGDYFIEKESYSGAICREVLEAHIKSQLKLYGEADIETPWHINSFDANSSFNVDGWLSITGLLGSDKIELNDSFFKFGAFTPDGTPLAFGQQTPVGRYPITETGLTEENLPVLKNYIVAVYDGQLEIEQREIVVTASDGDWFVDAEGVPEIHATFEVQNDDRETYRMSGTDDVDSYADMMLMNSDTVEKFIRVTDGTAPAASSLTGQLHTVLTSEAREYEENGVKATMLRNGSNIWYDTAWYLYAPVLYLDPEVDHTLYPCEWCEQYHGFTLGTDHWHVTGYETKINQDAEKGDVLTVATVENPLGETVQNYKLRFVSGTLRVHPLRFQLKATVPMYVCMYAYNGDGEVVEPTEYGITNYSNGAIRVTDVNVDSTGGGFLITDKAPLDLLRGEMSMNMFGTQLVPGANAPANPERWVVAADESEGVDGVFLHLPLECFIAGGNVNDETVCTPVTKVQYTIAEYGKTVPELDDVELPDYIHGEPVTPSTTG